MNSNIVKPEKFGHLHLVYHFTVSLTFNYSLTHFVSITAKNTVTSPDFLVWKFCRKTQFPHSFGRFARNYAEMCLSAKFPHQEIRWNCSIFRSEYFHLFQCFPVFYSKIFRKTNISYPLIRTRTWCKKC